MTEEEFVEQIKANEINRHLLTSLPELQLPQCTLTAGCLFQTVWNLKSGNAPQWGIKDYDIFYFDADDLSWEAEDDVIQRAKVLLGSLAKQIEIKNQARVHLWYTAKFGTPYPQLNRVEDGIDRYLVSCTRVGMSVETGKVYAPDGFRDMWNGILRPNPVLSEKELFRKKCEAYQVRWPWLSVAC